MEIKEVYYTSHFKRAFKHLPKTLKKEIIEREMLFRKNCFDSRLKTHKLKGKLKGYSSFSIAPAHRILFQFLEDGQVLFVDVGGHSIYK